MRAAGATALVTVLFAVPVTAGDNADELYRSGRFSEAEKLYAGADMDNPKDIRYRYNRGCAAYQNSDYEGGRGGVFERAQEGSGR